MLKLLGLAAVLLFALAVTPSPSQGQTPEMDAKIKILLRFAREFVELTPGKGQYPASFTMGSDGEAPDTEKPAVKVKLSAPFSMARYEVTQELYEAVMGKNPSKWRGPRNSVEMVSWDEANAFCRKATAVLREMKALGDKEEIRLPSEAEWEYACRAGTTSRYGFGDKVADLKDYAWFKGNSKGEDPPVGKKKPNAWGLYDMHGYVWEWCADVWNPTHEGADTTGKPRTGKRDKCVIRGGSWTDDADSARSAFRAGKAIDTRSDAIGFRCVKAAVKAKE
jgi:formylglycine-generating enzyme required for sulfatase activity